MNIYTSYFANLRNIDLHKFKPISIARWQPSWLSNMLVVYALAPSTDLLKRTKAGQVTNEQYATEFSKQLSTSQPHAIYKLLEDIANGKDIVLLCYERPTEFCHRHIVAKWLSDNLHINVSEL